MWNFSIEVVKHRVSEGIQRNPTNIDRHSDCEHEKDASREEFHRNRPTLSQMAEIEKAPRASPRRLGGNSVQNQVRWQFSPKSANDASTLSRITDETEIEEAPRVSPRRFGGKSLQNVCLRSR